MAAGRDAIRAIRETGAAGARYEIPGTVPRALVVVGDEAEVARLLRAPAREPMLGGRRAGDRPSLVLTFDEPGPGMDGPLVVDSPDPVTVRRWLKAAVEASKPVALSGLAAYALYYSMATGKPMESDRKENDDEPIPERRRAGRPDRLRADQLRLHAALPDPQQLAL